MKRHHFHLRVLIMVGFLLSLLPLSHARAVTGPTLTINASAANQYPISPYIYGINFADESLAAELKLPVRRWGGNAVTRYNYLNDTSNRGSDWYFENIPSDNPNPGALPDGSDANEFIDQDRRTGTSSLITLPTIGWTPKSRGYDCGFSIAKYGAQQGNDWQWRPDCGNGIRTNGTSVTGNDPTDTSTAITPTFVQGWIQYLISRYKTAAQGGVKFYELDNEPFLWNSTHRDVHPLPTSYDEMRDRAYQYAPAIKQSDPTALILGPSEWGWTGYFYSALDAAPGGAWWNNPQDRNAHGGAPFVEWYLAQMKNYETQHGLRILDFFDEHYYPAANGVSLSGAGDANTQALRLRTTRSLWDATYMDESWISDGNPTAVRLIPRMRDWVNTFYPGTKLAITEYNWGATDHLNGALAQADVLGIFGREKLDLATLWGPGTPTQPWAYAFRMYRNYDGQGAMFGEIGVSATSADQSQLSVYGALRGRNMLTLIMVNKTGSDLTSTVNLSGFGPAASAKVYRYSGANLNAIVQQANQAISGSSFSATFPTNSITLIAIPRAATSLDTIGIYRRSNATFYLRNSNTTGGPDTTVTFGNATSYPVVGDWNGDGIDTIGVFDQTTGVFSLRDSNTAGTPNYTLVLGNPNDMPLAGRWFADMTHDGVGVFRPSNGIIYLKKVLSSGFDDAFLVMGNPSDIGIAGDWNNDGIDSPGIFRPPEARFYITNKVVNGIVFADSAFYFGGTTDLPIIGDWTGTGHSSVGVFRNGAVSLRNALSTGGADISFAFGGTNDIPVAGHWTTPSLPPPPILVENGNGSTSNNILTDGSGD
jgi:hypothetical protein